jgi:hypothetical protein
MGAKAVTVIAVNEEAGEASRTNSSRIWGGAALRPGCSG